MHVHDHAVALLDRPAVRADPWDYLDRVAQRFLGATLWYVPLDRPKDGTPAATLPDAVDRLIALYAREKSGDESAHRFFARIGLDAVRGELADLERLTAADAVAADFVDLGESAEFTPEVMDGECSA